MLSACYPRRSQLVGVTTSLDVDRDFRVLVQRAWAVAQPKAAPTICANTKPVTSWGRIPANVWVSERAKVTAGFAKDVLAVNQ